MSARNAAKNVLWAVILLVLSALAINRFGPTHVDADTVLPALMSIKHVTVFYWEQDRFANLVPLLLSPVKNPSVNMIVYMMVFCVSFYALTILMAAVAWRLVGGRRGGVGVAACLGLAGTALVFSSQASCEYMLGSQPYALSYALLLGAFLLAVNRDGTGWSRWGGAVGLVFLGTGLNNSIILVGGALAFGWAVLTRRFRTAVGFLVVLGVMFAVWYGISIPCSTGEYRYFGADSNHVVNLVEAVIRAQLYIRVIPVAVATVVLGAAFLLWRTPQDGLLMRVLWLSGVTALAYFVVIAQNTHVVNMSSPPRYFFPVWFAAVFMLTCLACRVVLVLKPVLRMAVGVACLAGYIYFLAQPYTPLRDYTVFSTVRPITNSVAAQGIQFMAGTYWKAWPVVFSLMVDNRVAHGLAHRARGDAVNVLRAIAEEEERTGSLRVACVPQANRDVEECMEQVQKVTNDVWRREVMGTCGPGCTVLKLTRVHPASCRPPTCLTWSPERNPDIHSTVGKVQDGVMTASGRSGYVVFGPYVAMKAGTYRFTLLGSLSCPQGQSHPCEAWVDINSRNGTSAVMPGAMLQAQPPGSPVLFQRDVVFNNKVDDLEVRVYSNGQPTIQLRGYSLEPVGSGP